MHCRLFESKPLRGTITDLTHWGRVTHICVTKLTIIGSNNGLSPGRRQAIIWTNDGILLIWPLGTIFSELLIGIHIFSFKKLHLKMSSGYRRPFCFGLNVLMPVRNPGMSSSKIWMKTQTFNENATEIPSGKWLPFFPCFNVLTELSTIAAARKATPQRLIPKVRTNTGWGVLLGSRNILMVAANATCSTGSLS